MKCPAVCRQPVVRTLVLAVLLVMLVACGDSQPESAPVQAPAASGDGAGSDEASGHDLTSTEAVAGREPLQVLVDPSLGSAFEELLHVFAVDHHEIETVLRAEPLAPFVIDAEESAGFGVVASADVGALGALVEAGDASTPIPFASDQLVLVTGSRNAELFPSLSDVVRAVNEGRKRVHFVIPGIDVPVGQHARLLIEGIATTNLAAPTFRHEAFFNAVPGNSSTGVELLAQLRADAQDRTIGP